VKRILVIEDDPELRDGLRVNLQGAGYDVLTARDGAEGLQSATRDQPDAIILDVMMPKLGGFDVCRALRKRGVEVPIVFLTARGQEADKIAGLALGADDYVTKPFSIHELIARLRAVLRRAAPGRELGTYQFGDVQVDFDAQQLHKRGENVRLSYLEFEVLHYMVSRRGHVVARDDLMASVWGYEALTTRAVDNLVARLRNKLEDDPRRPQYILSAYGAGYKFVG
jgi:DNA-binding response OmpR family regulator